MCFTSISTKRRPPPECAGTWYNRIGLQERGKNMSVVLTEVSEVEIPNWVTDLNAFRRWVHSLAVPEDARVYWVDGKVWVDMSKEQIFSHVDVKTEIVRGARQLGDRVRLRPD